jgi:homoserine dehydrogenase
LRIAIAGLGTVGGGVVKALAARQEELAERAGRALLLTAVSARDRTKARGFDLPGWSDDPLALAKGDADLVVELIKASSTAPATTSSPKWKRRDAPSRMS